MTVKVKSEKEGVVGMGSDLLPSLYKSLNIVCVLDSLPSPNPLQRQHLCPESVPTFLLLHSPLLWRVDTCSARLPDSRVSVVAEHDDVPVVWGDGDLLGNAVPPHRKAIAFLEGAFPGIVYDVAHDELWARGVGEGR